MSDFILFVVLVSSWVLGVVWIELSHDGVNVTCNPLVAAFSLTHISRSNHTAYLPDDNKHAKIAKDLK